MTGKKKLIAASLLPAAALGLAACGFAEDGEEAEPVDPEIVDTAAGSGWTVSFTFDDGPNPGETERLLDVLRENDVTAVFCLIGDNAADHPDLVRRIVDEGHALCNHSLRHDDMLLWEPDRVREDLEAANEAIREAVPDAEIRYFRAPNGSWGESAEVAAELGMIPLGGAITIEDWEPATPAELLERLRNNVVPGGIVVLHDGGGDRAATVDAVETIVPEMKSEGWTFELPAR